MDKIFTVPVREAIKEALRLVVLAVIAWAISGVAQLDNEYVLVITTVLRGVDKWIHENQSRFNGLLPF